MAESVRIPTATGSLIILVVTFQDETDGGQIRRDVINGIYRKAAGADKNGYLVYSDRQMVSSDIVGHRRAGAIIEGHETHTRTAEVTINLAKSGDQAVKVPVTQAVIYGWYDNEYGSYVNCLGGPCRFDRGFHVVCRPVRSSVMARGSSAMTVWTDSTPRSVPKPRDGGRLLAASPAIRWPGG